MAYTLCHLLSTLRLLIEVDLILLAVLSRTNISDHLLVGQVLEVEPIRLRLSSDTVIV